MNTFHMLMIKFFVVVLFVYVGLVVDGEARDAVPFDANYKITWGYDHVLFLNQGRELQLSLDINSGTGFASKLSYGSGFFHMSIKVPKRDCAGVITSFYLISNTNNHDELDFEFLGNREGKPITLQTNVFTNGQGGREQRILLWFDPTADFHNYKVLWNQYHIVFYIDETPIRVFKNYTSNGIMYPTQAMQVQGSIYNGDSWATDGGRTKINWASAPFIAHYQDFNIVGCPTTTTSQSCHSSNNYNYWWNEMKYSRLNGNELKAYRRVREEFMNYDYCTDRSRYPNAPPECALT